MAKETIEGFELPHLDDDWIEEEGQSEIEDWDY